MKRVLVVGGTGMLRGCTLALSEMPDYQVSVLSRRGIDAAGVESIVCDYSDSSLLVEAVEAHVEQYGRFDRAALWIHSDAPDAPAIISGYIDGDILRVRGSRAAGPQRAQGERVVTLGWTNTSGSPRWLTHEEISKGVLNAFIGYAEESVVGTVGEGGPS